MSRKKVRIIVIIFVIAVLLIVGIILTIKVFVPFVQHKRSVKAMQEYYDNKIEIYTKENENVIPYDVDVVFLGDSITDGCNLQKYYPQYKTLNRGIGGDTTSGLLTRLKISVYDVKPKVCVMLIGANNMDTMFKDYEDILRGFEKNIPDTEIVLVSLTAMGGDFRDKNQLAQNNNLRIKSLADDYGYHYVDVFKLLLDKKTNEIFSEYSQDGVHLTDKGYSVMTSAINEKLEEILIK